MTGISLIHRSLIYMFTRKAIYFFAFVYMLFTVIFTTIASFGEFEFLFHVVSWIWLAWVTYFIIHDRRGERPTLLHSFFKSIELLAKGWWLIAFLIAMQLFINYVYFVLPHTTPHLVLYLVGYALIILVPFFVLPLIMDDVTRYFPVLRYSWFKLKHGRRALLVFFLSLVPFSFMIFALVASSVLLISTVFNVICATWIPEIYCISGPFIGNFIVYHLSRTILYLFVASAQSIFYQSMIYGRD